MSSRSDVATDNPARGLGIAAIVFAFVFSLLGLILGLVARSQSKKAGFGNGPATAAIVISIVSILFWIGAGISLLVIAGDRYDDLAAQCDQLGPGIHVIDGEEVPCT